MENFDRRSRSLWMDTQLMGGAQKLTSGHECDTVIVGAGIAGISTAYELACGGQKVIVIDRGDRERNNGTDDSSPCAAMR